MTMSSDARLSVDGGTTLTICVKTCHHAMKCV